MISIIIPAYNEEGNLKQLFDKLINLKKNEHLNCEIILVNDNSSDNTKKIAEDYARNFKFVKVINRKKGDNGMGYALREGTKKARGDLIIWTMGDNSDDITTFPKIIRKLKDYDMVFGARYIAGGSRGDLDPVKAFISRSYSLISKLILGIEVHDITNAFRGFKKEVFNNIKLESGDFAISPEFAIKAHLKKFKLGEVPTTYNNRKAGKTKFKMIKMGIQYVKLFKYKFYPKNKF